MCNFCISEYSTNSRCTLGCLKFTAFPLSIPATTVPLLFPEVQCDLDDYDHDPDHRSIGCGLSRLFAAYNFQGLHPVRQSSVVAVVHLAPKILRALLVDLRAEIVHLFQPVFEDLIRLLGLGVSSFMPQILRPGVRFERGIAATKLTLRRSPRGFQG